MQTLETYTQVTKNLKEDQPFHDNSFSGQNMHQQTVCSDKPVDNAEIEVIDFDEYQSTRAEKQCQSDCSAVDKEPILII